MMGGEATRSGRTFLFLQGLASPFFVELGRSLASRGHGVERINLSFGDAVFWTLPATSYRGTLAGWRAYLATFLRDRRITDIVLFGDCRPYHRVAISLAGHRRVQVHVFEEGYLRPNWITAERGGVNGNSSLPRDAETIRALAASIEPSAEAAFRGNFLRRALWDIAYNAALVIGRPLYPRYRRHRPHHITVEYAGWIKRFARSWRRDARAAAEVKRAAALPDGFFLVPLQLDSDYQLRVHSRFAGLGEFIDEVCASFASHAPPGVELLLKVHPLDNGLVDWVGRIARAAERCGIAGRVKAIDGGYLPTLLGATRGVIVVNSTVGTTALEVGRPVLALGNAIYNLPGLTFQDGLDRFWTEGKPADPELFSAFRRLVIQRTQINGGYFCSPGIGMGVPAAAARLEASEPMLLYADGERPDGAPVMRRGNLRLYPDQQPAE